MPRPRTCSPPRTIRVKGHWRTVKARRKKRAPAPAPWVVRDSRNGRVVSRHKHWDTAVRARKRLDRTSYRAGRGRPYEVGRA